MKRWLVFLVLLLVFTAPVHNAAAHDQFPPEWRGQWNTLFAHWYDFDDVVPGPPDQYFPDDWYSIPGGLDTPYLVTNGTISEGTVILDDQESISLDLDNFDDLNPLKEGRLQITFLDDPAQASVNPWDRLAVDIFPDPDTASASISQFDYSEDDDWITLAWDFAIVPNPLSEVILIQSQVDNLVIDQIVVDTICSAIPVPTGAWLLGSGIIGLVGLRRRLWRP